MRQFQDAIRNIWKKIGGNCEWSSIKEFSEFMRGKHRKGYFFIVPDPTRPAGPGNYLYQNSGCRMDMKALTHDGVFRSLNDWASRLGVSKQAVSKALGKYGTITKYLEARNEFWTRKG